MKRFILLSAIIILYASSHAQRDPYLWPFSSRSIWNMPIHNNAVYVPAGLTAFPGHNIWATMPGLDEEHIVLKPTAPATPIYYCSVAWGSGDRCIADNPLQLRATVPIPANYLVPDGNGNSCAAFLAADGRTIIQNQPLARCIAGGYATGYAFFPNVDLYGTGESGNHGGSRLSGIGGSIRVGELRPGQQGPRHALKVVVYAKQFLYKGTSASQCFRWPATTADSYAVGWYGTDADGDGSGKANTNTAMKMGALLAIPPSVNINSMGLETEPAKQLAWTLQNYGAYIVDDTYAAGFCLATEDGPDGSVKEQFQSDYGMAMLVKYNDNTAWMRDIGRLCVALNVVNNNDANNIGGGPTNDTINRRQPMACPFGTPGSGITTCLPSQTPDALFCNPSQAPVIDGVVENAWTQINADTLKNVTIGTVASSTDLSATFKAMWDNTALYILVHVKDDVLQNNSGTSTWDDDAVEIFVDGNNDKATSYDANDHHYILRWNDAIVYEYHNGNTTQNPSGVTFSQGANAGGYLMEIKITWSSIGTTASQGKLVGFDVQVNDDDNGVARDKKIAWIATTDISANNPSSFGIIKLDNASCAIPTGVIKSIKESGVVIYPNPFNSNFTLKISSATILKNAIMKIYDLCGKEIKNISVSSNETIIEQNELQSGIYFYRFINNNEIIDKGKLIVQ